jgi:hypothetical protein
MEKGMRKLAIAALGALGFSVLTAGFCSAGFYDDSYPINTPREYWFVGPDGMWHPLNRHGRYVFYPRKKRIHYRRDRR